MIRARPKNGLAVSKSRKAGEFEIKDLIHGVLLRKKQLGVVAVLSVVTALPFTIRLNSHGMTELGVSECGNSGVKDFFLGAGIAMAAVSIMGFAIFQSLRKSIFNHQNVFSYPPYYSHS